MIKSRRMTWAGKVVHMGMRNVQKTVGWKPEGNRPLRRPMFRQEDNIKIELRETMWKGVD
jgi:hypothetical protein